MDRSDGRTYGSLRPVSVTRRYLKHSHGSCLFELGDTRVLCAASITEGVAQWRRGSGKGWVTAEYAMLPASTHTRSRREATGGGLKGRTHEIQRLIGRSLRTVVDMGAMGGEVTMAVDCDVIQADGGTRTAAITGAYVALHDAVSWLHAKQRLRKAPEKVLHRSVSAVSVGVVEAEPRLDLCYTEDVAAAVDMNIVCTGAGEFVEVQGTGESGVFSREELNLLLDLGVAGCRELAELQQVALAS